MHGNHHHRHHQRTNLGGIMSITSVFTIGPFVPCTHLQNPKYASDVNITELSNKMTERGLKNINVFYSTFTNVF